MSGSLRLMYPGGNTCRGFHSFYDYILPAHARRVVVLKGGPGVGKSTFMKKVGEGIREKGYDIEYHCCSSDNDSIDGIVVPFAKIGVIDGTYPHVVDPQNPGAVDEIIHLGDFWDEAGLRKHKEKIMTLNSEVGRLFKIAYKYLAQAKLLKEEMELYYSDSDCLDRSSYYNYSWHFMNEFLSNADFTGKPGFARHLFASAITPGGLVNNFDTLFTGYKRRLLIAGQYAQPRQEFLQRFFQETYSRGYNMEVYHCALEPYDIEHLLVPELDLAVISSIEPHTIVPASGDTVWSLSQFIEEKKLKPVNPDLQVAREKYWAALERAVDLIWRSKKTHDEMEEYYIPHMDFAKIEGVRKKVEVRFQRYIEEAEGSR